jgi:transposase InsO family protein
MGQFLHGSATTTEAVRRAIQHSQESLRGLAKRYGINTKTVAKWRKRSSVTYLPTGPREPRSTELTLAEEAIIVAFRRHTLLPLDDCLYALQATIPTLTRSALHRCLQRHGISRLPETEGDKPTRVAADFLRVLLKVVPYRIHTVLTDNGIHFTMPGNIASAASLIREAMDRGEIFRAHAFEYACAQNHIEYRLTKPYHPWTSAQVERMNRTLKEVTVRRFHYATHGQLQQHLGQFLDAYNFAKRLKTLNGLTPYEAICKAWAVQPSKFTANPHHQMPRPNT